MHLNMVNHMGFIVKYTTNKIKKMLFQLRKYMRSDKMNNCEVS